MANGERAWYRRVSDPLTGPDATTAELLLGWGAAFLAAAVQLVWALRFGHWSALQTAVAVLFAFDIGGGVVVNATRSGRRYWHRVEMTRAKELTFFAAHVHPFIVAWLWPGFSLMQAAGLYASMLACAVLVAIVTPDYLKRPVAFGLTAIGLVLGVTVFRTPPGLVWLPLLYYVKLIAAHAVPDE
ncbi:MAG: hypothetical protein FDZ75_01910 [Actinobacteria bacterium]|nr:MAG: hypothetical protein FDZ75_01910 [Actinomycetota bacterium]